MIYLFLKEFAQVFCALLIKQMRKSATTPTLVMLSCSGMYQNQPFFPSV